MSSDGGGVPRPSLRRNLGFLITGTVFAQGIQFTASLLLTRLYTPAEFGQYASMLSIATVLGSLCVLSYPRAIPLAKTDDDSRILTWLAIALASTSAMITTIFLAGMVIAGASVFGFRPNWLYAVFIPLTAFSVAAWSTLQLRQSRIGSFGRVSVATATGAATQVGVQVTAGWLGASSAGLSYGYLLGRLANVALLVRGARMGRPPRFSALRRAAGQWSEMPRWLLLPTVMNLLGTSAITPWVARHYGLSIAGSFAFALLMLSVPAALVGRAVATILYPRLAESERNAGVALQEVESHTARLASVALPVFLPVLVLGPQLFRVVFGGEWAPAGQIAAILSPWIAANFVSSPLSSLAVVKGRYGSVAFLGTLETVARVTAIALGGLLGSPTTGFALYSLVGVVISSNYTAWVLRLAGGSLGGLIRRNWQVCLLTVLGVVGLLAARLLVPIGVLVALTGIATIALGVVAVGALRPMRGERPRPS